MSSAEAPPSRDEGGTPRTGPELSVTQIVASTLATVTATVVASFFGVTGTVIGAAVASVVTVIGNTLYSRSLHRVRSTLPARADARPRLAWRQLAWRRLSWRHAALGAVGLFVVVAGILTAVELAAGRPLNKIVHDQGGSGTSLFGGGHPASHPDPTPTSSTTTPSTTNPSTPAPSSAADDSAGTTPAPTAPTTMPTASTPASTGATTPTTPESPTPTLSTSGQPTP